MSDYKSWILTSGVFILLLAGSMFFLKPRIENPQITFIEAPLIKNKQFQLKAGESYTYTYKINNSAGPNMTYVLFQAPACTIIRLAENTNASYSSVCVDKWGLDESKQNTTYTNPIILLFKPWMLALHEQWRWNSSIYMIFDGNLKYISMINYRVLRTDRYRGRSAFVVSENIEGSQPQIEWIDTEKRILLKVQGRDYEVELIKGIDFSEE